MSRHSLRSLSDRQILLRIDSLTQRERAITLLVLLHLNEIERRRLHLKLGHSSMFDYCTSGLGYSASAASRRIRTARCVRPYPEIAGLLKSNAVNISTVAQVSRVLTLGNKDAILARIRGKSQREVEAIVAEVEPLAAIPRDRARTVVVRVPAALPSAPAVLPTVAAGAGAEVVSAEPIDAATDSTGPDGRPVEKHDRNGCVLDVQAEGRACPEESGGSATTLQCRTVLQFSASDAFMAKLEQVRSLMWHRLPAHASLEQVFELALDLMIERNDPSRRQKRTAALRQENEKEPRPRAKSRRSTTVTDVRHIPAATKDRVYIRDHGRCTFTGRNGRRCASTRALQIDHIKPVAWGGKGTKENLRLLCAYHNRLEAERLLGTTHDRAGP